MKLPSRLWHVGGLLVLATAGLFAPGLPGLLGTYVWLGVFPGMALVRLLLPRADGLTRWSVGLALSPLISALIGAAMLMNSLELQMGARIIGMAGWVLFSAGEARAIVGDDTAKVAPSDRWIWLVALAAVAFVAIPVCVNEWIRVHSDGLNHAAFTWEILQHGIPPMDPRFIGLKLNYVWFYNLFLAQLTSLRGGDMFSFMAIMNAVDMGLVVWLMWQLAWAVWGTRRAAKGAVTLLLLGLNAGAYLLWPLNLVRALQGDVRGWAEAKRLADSIRLDDSEVIYFLQAPYAQMVQFYDKFTLGTPIGYAWLMMLLHFLALARWLESGSVRWLLVGALATAGMQLFHGVVGMSVVPVTTGAVLFAAALALRFDALPRPSRLLAFGAATLAGFLACLPYTQAISKGWASKESGMTHHFLHFTALMPWTLLTACGVALAFAIPGVRRALAERRALAIWMAIWLAGMLAFALVVHLPESNEHKFVWPILAVIALLGGIAFGPAMDAVRRRIGAASFALAFAVVFLVPPALALRGFVLDPGGPTSELLGMRPGEEAMYAWMRDSTAMDVVVLDHRSRYVVNIKGQRRLLAGTPFGPERAAFPATDLARRRVLSADLFGAVGDFDHDLATLDTIRTQARRLHSVSDILVLYRPGDSETGPEPWRRLEAVAGDRARLRYDRDGFRIYQLVP